MPVFRSEKLKNGVQWVLWCIRESAEELKPNVFLTAAGNREWETLRHPQKRTEWLAGRMALQALCEELALPYAGIEKDEFGKPHLVGIPGHISISHCWPYAAAAYYAEKPVGIDLEMVQDKLVRLAPKFLDANELSWSRDQLDVLALRWSAKEALYKLHGRKKLAFSDQLKTGIFSPTEWGFFAAKIVDDSPMACRIYFEKIAAHHWLTVALERAQWQPITD
ncbi:MAG TPA: 4-phosphopantetheinyl transferase [Cytophagales bacterium]|nr:4-phosphopantetheinyl transferase [Cytophagales bacterium]HAA21386.1 4-phosphopantetheinyl transferase [Cytophagales bacterium]HAP59445.1 4-phosphopantetheinyl transferase [Cytophagales bacterium]